MSSHTSEDINHWVSLKLDQIIEQNKILAKFMKSADVRIESLDEKQADFSVKLAKLIKDFDDFVAADLKQKALQLAETRQGNLKQDLQIKFGYYAEVRRMATGILSSVDTGLVSNDTLRYTSEEIMLKAPRYWLAPAIVGLSAWIRNEPELTKKALAESIKRNDYKTTLFFMLAMRRLDRMDACLKWLKRYFSLQNPHNLDREFIIVLEAVTTGVLPPASRELMTSSIKSWLEELTKADNYINNQKVKWISFFVSKIPSAPNKYPLLTQYAANWSDLDAALNKAKVHELLHTFFRNIFAASSDHSKEITAQLDEILNLLVTNFDDEELPLQKEVRLNELIIQTEGDKAEALSLMDNEQSIFDVLQMLTNASFNPELSGATKVTQALAVSISQPWILEAHDSFTANCRKNEPQSINLKIRDFSKPTKFGTDEDTLVQDHENFWNTLKIREVDNMSYPYALVWIGGFIFFLGVLGMINSNTAVGLVVIFIGLLLIFFSMKNHYDNQEAKKKEIDEMRNRSLEVLRGCIAEAVDFRRELRREDDNAEKFRRMLKSVTQEDYSSISRGVRNIVQ